MSDYTEEPISSAELYYRATLARQAEEEAAKALKEQAQAQSSAKLEARAEAQRRLREIKKDPAIDALKELSGNCCEICGDVCVLNVDHNHETGEFRGLLCKTCNAGLGMFRDNPELLAQAIIYLLRS